MVSDKITLLRQDEEKRKEQVFRAAIGSAWDKESGSIKGKQLVNYGGKISSSF